MRILLVSLTTHCRIFARVHSCQPLLQVIQEHCRHCRCLCDALSRRKSKLPSAAVTQLTTTSDEYLFGFRVNVARAITRTFG